MKVVLSFNIFFFEDSFNDLFSFFWFLFSIEVILSFNLFISIFKDLFSFSIKLILSFKLFISIFKDLFSSTQIYND